MKEEYREKALSIMRKHQEHGVRYAVDEIMALMESYVEQRFNAAIPDEKSLHTHNTERGGCANDIRTGFNQAIAKMRTNFKQGLAEK